jgi:hypothetical protein
MIQRLILFFFMCLPVLASAQKKDKNAMKAAASINAEDMKKHLYIIASKEMEGRDTPSPGLEKAANYIEDYFKSVGLTPGNNGSYRQYYSLYKETMKDAAINIDGNKLLLHNDFQPLQSNYSASMRFSEVVFAGYGIVDGDKRNDYKDLNVAGKLVLIADGIPADYKPTTGQGFGNPSSVNGKMTAALKLGASGILIVYANFPRKAPAATEGRWSMSGFKSSQSLFGFAISTEIAGKILREDGSTLMGKIQAGTIAPKAYKAELELSYTGQVQTEKVSNVLGLLEGTDKKDEYVVITAHYDHIGKRNDTTIYYGADDDGSGTTGVLELAEAFVKAKAEGKGPRRSILFMTVSGEEKGLWGSRYYSEHPVYPLEKTTVDLNIDMIGRIGTEYLKDKDSTNYVYIIGDDKLSTDLAPITDMINNNYMSMKLDRKYNDPKDPNRFYFRSDHYNFAEKGVPIIFYFNGTHADYHRPTDTPDKINYPMMAKRTQLVFYTAWEMANRNEMLKRDVILEKPRGF